MDVFDMIRDEKEEKEGKKEKVKRFDKKMDYKLRMKLRKEKTLIDDREKRPYCQVFRTVSKHLLKISLCIIICSFGYMIHFIRNNDDQDRAEYYECLQNMDCGAGKVEEVGAIHPFYFYIQTNNYNHFKPIESLSMQDI